MSLLFRGCACWRESSLGLRLAGMSLLWLCPYVSNYHSSTVVSRPWNTLGDVLPTLCWSYGQRVDRKSFLSEKSRKTDGLHKCDPGLACFPFRGSSAGWQVSHFRRRAVRKGKEYVTPIIWRPTWPDSSCSLHFPLLGDPALPGGLGVALLIQGP